MVTLEENFAHSDGLAVVCCSADGSRLYSGGSDGLIRMFNAATESREEDATVIDTFLDTSITSLDCSVRSILVRSDVQFDSLVVGTEDGRVALLDPASGELKSLLTRADVGHAIRSARFGCSGKKVAVASDDLVVKVIDVRDTSKIQLLAGHTRAVRAVSWAPDGNILTTSGCDGILRIWDLSSTDTEPACLKVLDGIVPTSKSSDTVNFDAIWHPSGQYFAVSNRTHEIVVISRSTWTTSGTFESTEGNHNCTVVALAWSPNGNYLASAGEDGSVIIWETSSKSSILKAKADGQLCDLAWQTGPGANTVALTDMRGAFLRWFDVIPASRSHPTDAAPFAAVRERSVAPSVVPPPRQRLRQQSAQTAQGNGVDDLFGADLDDDDDWIVDDTGDGYKQSKDDLPPPLAGLGRALPTARNPLASLAIGGSSTQRGQDAFQPGSTPLREKRRYLAFNQIGVIHTLERDGYNAVTVDFHDRGAHRSSHFEDPSLFSLAGLSERGALYATTTDASLIAYRAHEDGWAESSGAQSGWTSTLPKGEKAISLALGTRCALIGTDVGYLRFFSAGGIQTHLIDLGRDIVALAVSDEWAFVVHRAASATVDDRQDLSYSIYDIDTFELVQEGAIPLAKKTQLSWIGFSEDQIPALYKSNGVMSVLDRARRPRQARWVPILDSNTLERRQGKQESYWPVHLSSTYMHCVILKGEEKHPYFPTPLLQDLELKVPGCEVDTAKGQLEEEYLRTGLMLGNQRDGAAADDEEAQASINAAELELDKLLLRQIQAACKADKLGQALELVKLLNRTTSIDAAAKIAGFFHAAGLEERIIALRDEGDPGAMQPMKRAPKWQHLIDDSTMPQPRRAGSNGYGRQIDPFSKPFGTSIAPSVQRAQSRMQSTPAPRNKSQQQPERRRQVSVQQHDDSGLGSSDGPLEFGADVEEGEDTFEEAQRPMFDEPESMQLDREESEPLNFDDSMAVEEQSVTPPIPMTATRPAATTNPFKKTALAKTASGSTVGVSARSEHGLKKSASFFDRVEGGSNKTTKGKKNATTTSDGSRQSTLFGLPPPKPADGDAPEGGKKKRGGGGKKRKNAGSSAVVESQDENTAPEPAIKVDQLKAAFAKAAAKPKKVPVVEQIVDSDDEEFGETQIVEHPAKRQRLETVQEDEEFDAAMQALGAPAA